MGELRMEESEILKALNEDSKWITENYDALKKYEGKVIAIKNKKIIRISDDLQELLEELEEDKEDAAFLLIEAIPPKNVSFIL